MSSKIVQHGTVADLTAVTSVTLFYPEVLAGLQPPTDSAEAGPLLELRNPKKLFTMPSRDVDSLT